jgi:hypothetical protein
MLNSCRLDLDFSPFIAADYSQHSGSCIRHQVHELTDIHESHGGFPDSYTMANTLIHQLWWAPDQIDYQELERQLGIEVVTVSTIMQPAGNVIPLHRDTFYQIKHRYPQRQDLKVRANIYMQDWKVGHVLQYQDLSGNYRTHDDWHAGDGWIWDSEPLHLSCNAGFEPKFTMQISGFYKR